MIFMSIIVFSIVTIATHQEKAIFHSDFNQSLFMILIPCVLLGTLMASSSIYKNFLRTARNRQSLAKKLQHYQSGFILKMAFFEAPALLGVIGFYLEYNLLYLVYTGIAAILMLMNFPSAQNVIKDLQLKGDELEVFEKDLASTK